MKNSFLPLLNKIKYSFALSVLIFFLFSSLSKGQCPITFTSNVCTFNQTIASVYINDTTGGLVTIYFEYGLAGFVPGTDSLPGIGGTITPVTITAQGLTQWSIHFLTPNTTYDIYARKKCGYGSYSANTVKQTFFTYDICNSAQPKQCDQIIHSAFATGYGGWSLGCGGQGREQFYSFTPAGDGTPIINIYPDTARVTYYWCQSFGSPCFYEDWNCIGTNNDSTAIQFQIPFQFVAGEPIYILAKPNFLTGGPGGSIKMDCPCTYPTNLAVSNVTQYSGVVSYSGGIPATLIELDSTGYQGLGSAPGPGGSVYNGGYAGMAISGLTPGQTYRVSARNLCPSGYFYSHSTNYVFLSTLPCPPLYIMPTIGGSFQSSSYGSHLNPNLWYSCYGDSLNKYPEDIVKFTPPATGYYSVVDNSLPYNVYLAYRQTNNTCDFTGFIALCSGSISNFKLYLTGGVTYDFLVEPITLLGFSSTITIGGPIGVTNISVSPIQNYVAYINFSGACTNTLIEYGPTGFTPGTGGSAGGGTLVTNAYSHYPLTGLTSNLQYDVYVRCQISGGIFSPNSFMTFRTLIDCNNTPLVTCGSPFTHSQTINDSGNWNSYNCGTTNNNGPEIIYRFSPILNGVYKIRCTQNTGNLIPVNIYYKLATGSCDSLGWTCLGSLTSPGDSVNTGPLVANSNYLFLFDEVNSGNAFTKTFQIDCNTVCSSTPSNPTSITGLIKPCPGASGIIYNVAPVANANSYTWNVPAGATIVSGAGTNSITVNYDSTFVSGDITVTADNSCGSSAAKIKSVSRNVPNTPPGIIGTAYGMCGGKTATYSINVSSLTNTYLWSVPSGVTINSGQGTKNISVTFPANFSPATITVKAGNTCGYGNAQTLVVNATPKPPTIIYGPNTVCVNQTGVIYNISSSSNKTTYNWGVPTGAIITSGQGTSAIKMNFGTVAGDITVNTANVCGAGSNRILSVAIVCREGISTMNDALEINIYPNPSNNYFTVDAHFATEGNYNLTVRDILGRLVEIDNDINYQQSFNFGKTLHSGIYFVEVSKGDERQVLRVVKSDY